MAPANTTGAEPGNTATLGQGLTREHGGAEPGNTATLGQGLAREHGGAEPGKHRRRWGGSWPDEHRGEGQRDLPGRCSGIRRGGVVG